MKESNRKKCSVRSSEIDKIIDITFEWFDGEVGYEELKTDLKTEWNIHLSEKKYRERLFHYRRNLK